MTQVNDKRVHSRVSFSTDVECFDHNGMQRGEIASISLGGMLIKARNLPSPGNHILVRFKLPVSERIVWITSTVVWVSSENSDGDIRSMGIVFDQISEEDRRDLTDYLALHSDDNVKAGRITLTKNRHDTGEY